MQFEIEVSVLRARSATGASYTLRTKNRFNVFLLVGGVSN
jgi:hypothetical protein